MTFKLPDSYYERKKEKYEKKYISIDGKSVHVSELKDRSITPETQARMVMNSYAQDDLPPKLTNEALIKTAEHYLSHCSRPITPCTTYEESLIHKIMPELIKRLKGENE